MILVLQYLCCSQTVGNAVRLWTNHRPPTGRCPRTVVPLSNQRAVRGGRPLTSQQSTNKQAAGSSSRRAELEAALGDSGGLGVPVRAHGPASFIPDDMWTVGGLSVALALAMVSRPAGALREGECEVCLTFLGKFYETLKNNNVKFTTADIEKEILKSCEDAKGKENRFCYYIGATSDAATKMINEVSKPLSSHVPVDKICDKLRRKDGQICELRYDKQLDLSSVDLKKLKVKDLKKILEDWGESCKGCAEKSDFIRKITQLMPKYAPAAASARTDL